MALHKKTTPSIYQLKVTLKESKPPIWRRILVASNISLHKLHNIIQITMGWDNSHLHQFIVQGQFYGAPDFDMTDDMEDEKNVSLDQVMYNPKGKLIYEYDFGDSWEHVILLEKILPPEAGIQYPVCVKGKRACPPEDSGGIWGYAELMETIQDPDHPEHEEMLEWLGGDFDPEAFDLDEINRRLKRIA